MWVLSHFLYAFVLLFLSDDATVPAPVKFYSLLRASTLTGGRD
jgi:hypothetical protein